MSTFTVLMATRDIALCHEAPARQGDLAHALCTVTLIEGQVPEWIELLPVGDIAAVDGRKFTNPNPEKVVARFNADPNDLPIDYEHATEIKGPKGEEAPASGWVTELEVRAGAIWGKAQWTPRGAAALTSREYRYLSPAFTHNKFGEVIELSSAGLTNRPALRLAALAHLNNGAEKPMTPEQLKILGLDEKATPEMITAALTKLQSDAASASAKVAQSATELATARAETERARVPDLTKFVPRADYDATLLRAQSAEKSVADAAAAKQKSEVDAEIDAALKAGKITPATTEYHRASCSREGGLAAFREYVKAAPVVAPDRVIDEKKPPVSGGQTEPSADLLAIATRAGVTVEMLKKVMPAAQ